MQVIIEGRDQGASATAERVGRGFRDLGLDADRLNRSLDAVDRNTGETVRSLDRLAAEARQADRALDDMDRRGQSFSRTGAAVGATISAITGVLAEAARASADAEASQARLEAAVNATGESYEEYAERLGAASEAALQLAFDDEKAQDALAALTTITGDANEALDLLSLSMDLARGRGIDLATAATIVGKVAEGNTAILQRYGIVIAEGATAQENLAALQQRFAGQAEAYAGTTQGAIDRLQNSFENWMESVGASTGELQTFLALLPGVSAGVQGVAAIVGGLAGAIGPIGLVAAAGAAAVAIGYLTLRHEDQTVAVEDVDAATQDLIATLNQLATTAGVSSEQFQTVAEWERRTEAIYRQSAAYEDLDEQARQVAADLSRGAGPDSFLGRAAESFENYGEVVDYATRVQEQWTVEAEDSARITMLLVQAAQYTGEQFAAVSAAVDEAFADFERGRIDVDGLIRRLEQLDEIALAAAESTTTLADAVNVLGDGVGVATDAMGDYASTLEYLDAQQAQANAAINNGLGPFQALAIAAREVAHDNTEAGDAIRAFAEDVGLSAGAAESAAQAHEFLVGTIAEATGAFRGGADAIDYYGTRLDALAGIESEASGTVNDLQQAYDILNQRIAAGETLTDAQLDFYNRAPGLIAEYTRESEDAAVAQGLLIANHEDARSAGEQLNDTMLGLTDVLRELVRVLGGEVPSAAQSAKTALADLLNLGGGGSPLAGALSGIMGGLAATPSPVTRAGPTPAAPPGLPVSPAPVVITFEADYSDVGAAALAVQALLEEATGEEYTFYLEGEGEAASAVIQDVEGEVVAVVSEDYVVVMEGDGSGAHSTIAGVIQALNDADGDSATVNVYANTGPAEAAIAAQLGYQGDAYVMVYGIPAGGPTADLFAAGGVVKAASGRVVRAGELGPEMVFPPGGSPYLAARDGLYVMQPGSYVRSAAATRGSRLGGIMGGINLTLNVYGSVGVDDIAERLVDMLDQSLAMAFEDRYTAIGWPYGQG